MSRPERLVLLRPPEIADGSVHAELNWQGLDRAAHALGELALGRLPLVMLAPAPNAVVVLCLTHRDAARAWNAAAIRGREALAICVTEQAASAAVEALSELAVGGSSRQWIELPARFARPGGERDGVLKLTRPAGARPPASVPRAALPAHALEATHAGSLLVELLWSDVAGWVERIDAAGEEGAALAIVDEAARAAALEWSPSVGVPGIALRDRVTTCSLPVADAGYLGTFLRTGIERGAFPVDHLDFQTGGGTLFTVRLPFDRATARFAS